MSDNARDDVGSLGDELQKLTGAFAQWANARGADSEAASESSERPASCDYCPICQLIALGRGQRPEAVAKLIDTATLALHALTEYLQSQDKPHEHQGPQGDTNPAPPEPKVQHIDID
ncbi:hypothetical protein CLV47_11099 [Antricoccus suffuscus]|uniref:Uncharacterized protein n=1 Tax=Antricoccus suffuscus TaxID=1629062 RepID=A0A2T0ZYE0_9ACTN|nr:hypothetical protein [Antricoccus suffuscus]PRZ41371.1 hypothetical protein CLV47_11099 [Antricoccus suffuscus]